MSANVELCCSRKHLIRWIRIAGMLTVLLVSMTSKLRYYRSIAAPELLQAGMKEIESSDIPNEAVLEAKTIIDKNNNTTSFDSNNDTTARSGDNIWPQLREKLCPRGVPKTSLGQTLFELGKIELGLAANATATPDNPQKALRNKQQTADFFYEGGFGFTLFLDGIDPTNTLFYASIWKCANNQIHAYLEHLFNRNSNGMVRDASKEQTNYANDTYMESLTISDLEFLFYEELERPKDDDSQQSIEASPARKGKEKDGDVYFTFNKTARTKPCVFTVLRDPISHFLSGYNEVEYRLISGDSDAPTKNLQKLASYTKIPYDQDSHQREKRFKTFVRNLLKEHPSFSSYYYYKHFASMSRILPTLSRFDLLPQQENDEAAQQTSSPTMWFLPTLENLTETFPKFLADRCPTMACNYQQRQDPTSNKECDASLPPMKRMGGHESSLDAYGTYRAAKDVWKQGGSTARALCALHVVDYACFDGMLEIPPLCQDVYGSEKFVATILSAE